MINNKEGGREGGGGTWYISREGGGGVSVYNYILLCLINEVKRAGYLE